MPRVSKEYSLFETEAVEIRKWCEKKLPKGSWTRKFAGKYGPVVSFMQFEFFDEDSFSLYKLTWE